MKKGSDPFLPLGMLKIKAWHVFCRGLDSDNLFKRMSDSGTCGCGKSAAACSTPAKTETKTEKKGGTVQNGKGDAPRNISEGFRSYYKGIKWTTGGHLAKGEKFVKKY
jgi:hypothetical protein